MEKGDCGDTAAQLQEPAKGRMKGQEKLKEGGFRLDIRKKFFPMRVVKHWPRLPREAVAAPSLAGFKARLDGALSTLVWWNISLLMAGGLGPDDLQGPFRPKPFYGSMIRCSVVVILRACRGLQLLACLAGKVRIPSIVPLGADAANCKCSVVL